MSLLEHRKERRLSLDAVGVMAGVDPATVNRIERGLVTPRPDTIVKLARGLGISASRMKQIIVESTDAAG